MEADGQIGDFKCQTQLILRHGSIHHLKIRLFFWSLCVQQNSSNHLGVFVLGASYFGSTLKRTSVEQYNELIDNLIWKFLQFQQLSHWNLSNISRSRL
jgi:hypothetical protein